MSQINVDAIRHTSASSDAITLASNGKCAVTGSTVTADTGNFTNLPNRNLIINGSMQVAQRGTSSTSNGYKTVDRFSHFSGGGTATWSVGTETSGTVWEKGLRKYLRCTNTANATAAGNYREITYKIENQDLMDSGWNPTSASSKLTLSFWVRASVAQTYYGRIRWMGDSGGTGDKNFVFSTGSLSANTWTKVTVSIPGLTGKTLNDGGSSADTASIFQLNWSPFQGTDGTASGTALNTWNAYASASKYPDYTTTWGSTDGATFDITGIQLEVGDYATDFEHRSYGDELDRCERYFQTWRPQGQTPPVVSTLMCHSSSGFLGPLHLRKIMRAAPTLSNDNIIAITSSNGSAGEGTLAIDNATPTCARLVGSSFSGLSAGNCTWLQCNDQDAYLDLSAEL